MISSGYSSWLVQKLAILFRSRGAVRSPSWPRWSDRFFARCSTCARDVSKDTAKRHFSALPRPPLQPTHQNRYRSAQPRDALKTGRDGRLSRPHTPKTHFDHQLRLYNQRRTVVLKFKYWSWKLRSRNRSSRGIPTAAMTPTAGTSVMSSQRSFNQIDNPSTSKMKDK
jgi:hypothetical protein